MEMLDTPRGNRLHIAIFGRRNAGKSSLINALTGQDAALVSDTPGTTTDPVFKAMELLPIGPVVFIDTAGMDDQGELGERRVERTRRVMDRTDVALLVVSPPVDQLDLEAEWLGELRGRGIPVVGVLNKQDLEEVRSEELEKTLGIRFVSVSAMAGHGIFELKEAIQEAVPDDWEAQPLVGDLVSPGDLVLLVAPQDIQAPKGRLILPQVQVARDVLDHDGICAIVKDQELDRALEIFKGSRGNPDLVITDSQVFHLVKDHLDPQVRLTSFSILMARHRGDLTTLVEGAQRVFQLRDGDSVLIAEACTHHPLRGDIGREKLPRVIQEMSGSKIDFHVVAGNDYPGDLRGFSLVVHCGGCMLNRKHMMTRIMRAKAQGVPITNYGVLLALRSGILQRATDMLLQPQST